MIAFVAALVLASASVTYEQRYAAWFKRMRESGVASNCGPMPKKDGK